MKSFWSKKEMTVPLISTFILTFSLLSFVRYKVADIILLDRFIAGSGWIVVIIVSIYAAVLCERILYSPDSVYWKKMSWRIFSFIFFIQLALGILCDHRFLMSGKLHLPVPMVILGGTVFRLQIGFMPILFLSAVLITGPAWCSYFCYFGAFDRWASSSKVGNYKTLKNKSRLKLLILATVIFMAIGFRIMQINIIIVTLAAGIFGCGGIVIILFLSRRKGKMIHCVIYCPLGTLVNYIGKLNPFRIKINNKCIDCLACISECKYDALSLKNIQKREPSYTCTLCGDCIPACNSDAIHYSMLKSGSTYYRSIYTVIVVVIHCCFLALARI